MPATSNLHPSPFTSASQANSQGATDARYDAADRRFDQLVLELARKEPELDRWLKSSEENALWFRKDPVAAIRAANLGLAEEVLKELESVTASILQKLRARF